MFKKNANAKNAKKKNAKSQFNILSFLLKCFLFYVCFHSLFEEKHTDKDFNSVNNLKKIHTIYSTLYHRKMTWTALCCRMQGADVLF